LATSGDFELAIDSLPDVCRISGRPLIRDMPVISGPVHELKRGFLGPTQHAVTSTRSSS